MESAKDGHVVLTRTLSRLFERHGVPGHIRSVNGPEFITSAVQAFVGDKGVDTVYIQPGAPWQNGCPESFNGTLGD